MNLDYMLSSVSQKINLTNDEKETFKSFIKPRYLKKGDFLLREGEICKYDSFINKGSLKNYYQDENGFEHIIDFLIEGWWANDLYSLLTHTQSKYYIKALEDTELLQISKNNLELLYQQIPKCERFFRLLFQNAYVAQREQTITMFSANAEERYLLFRQRKPYAEDRFSQKDIASYLGITPQFFSTLKKKLR